MNQMECQEDGHQILEIKVWDLMMMTLINNYNKFLRWMKFSCKMDKVMI